MTLIFLGKNVNLSSAPVYKLQKAPSEIIEDLEEFNYYSPRNYFNRNSSQKGKKEEKNS